MDTPDDVTPAPLPDIPEDDWRSQIESIRQLIQSMLILMVVISGTFNLYLFSILKNARGQVASMNKQLDDFKKDAARIDIIWSRLLEYGQGHPDFMPVLNKYGVFKAATNQAPAPVPPAGAAPLKK